MPADSNGQIDIENRFNRNLGLLQPGSTITIDVMTPAGQKGKFRSIFVGYMPKQYVLVQYPDSNKIGKFSQYLTQGASVTVRGLIEGHEGAVVAFVSNIKQTLQIPSRLIVLEFPRSAGLQGLRNAIRIDTDILSKVKVDQEYWKANINDMSISGCQLIVNNGESLMMANDKPIEITVENFEGITNVKLHAVICNIKQQNNGAVLGVKFDDASKEQAKKLLHHAVTIEAKS
jgi:c-di-GMP-binding flagellar brake protein YcgR